MGKHNTDKNKNGRGQVQKSPQSEGRKGISMYDTTKLIKAKQDRKQKTTG